MSFILDALRKAEAERERGNVPSIHAQPVLPGVAPSGPAGKAQVELGDVVVAIGGKPVRDAQDVCLKPAAQCP